MIGTSVLGRPLRRKGDAAKTAGWMSVKDNGNDETSPRQTAAHDLRHPRNSRAVAGAGQLEIDLYGGWSSTLDSDVRLQRPCGIKLSFHDVAWEGRSFEQPIYCGGRLSYWTRWSPQLGLAVDFTHARIHARLDRSVRVTGQVGGGGRLGFSHRFSAFAEYRLSHADLRADLDGGGSLRTEAWTHHLIVGLTVSFQ